MQDGVQEEDITKHETSGVEESTQVEIKDENMDTEDPLSNHIPQGKL